MDAKVNKGYTVTAHPQHRMVASCQLPMRVQSRLMGSKKALRKRENFSNSNPAVHGAIRRPAWV